MLLPLSIYHTNNHAFLSTCELWAAGTNSRVKNLFFTLASMIPLRGISKSQDKQVCQGECRFLGILQREKDLPSANRRTSKSAMLTLRNSQA
jgi:hypothetical protein